MESASGGADDDRDAGSGGSAVKGSSHPPHGRGALGYDPRPTDAVSPAAIPRVPLDQGHMATPIRSSPLNPRPQRASDGEENKEDSGDRDEDSTVAGSHPFTAGRVDTATKEPPGPHPQQAQAPSATSPKPQKPDAPYRPPHLRADTFFHGHPEHLEHGKSVRSSAPSFRASSSYGLNSADRFRTTSEGAREEDLCISEADLEKFKRRLEDEFEQNLKRRTEGVVLTDDDWPEWNKLAAREEALRVARKTLAQNVRKLGLLKAQNLMEYNEQCQKVADLNNAVLEQAEVLEHRKQQYSMQEEEVKNKNLLDYYEQDEAMIDREHQVATKVEDLEKKKKDFDLHRRKVKAELREEAVRICMDDLQRQELTERLLQHNDSEGSEKKGDDTWNRRQLVLAFSLATALTVLFQSYKLISLDYLLGIVGVFGVIWFLGYLAFPVGLFGTTKKEKNFSRHVMHFVYFALSAYVAYAFYLISKPVDSVLPQPVAPSPTPAPTPAKADYSWNALLFFMIWVLNASCLIIFWCRGCFTGGDVDKDL